ncbi:MAG: alpha/beta fold hydrolase, partial [Sphingobacteriales bacterium]
MNLLLIICLSALSAIAQELPRRSFLGVQMENISDDTRRIMNLPSKEGVLVKGIIPGSTAAAAGFQTGDVLLSINETKLNSISEAVAYVGSKKGNETFSYVIFRNGKKLSGRSTFSPYPEEKYSDLKVEYPAVKTSLGLQRLIVTTRKDGKSTSGHVYFIGGIGCYSLDTPQDTMRSEVQLLNMLARAGYTTVRLEKSGMGDAVGKSKSCEEISFTEEAESYAEAIASFRESSGHTGKVFVIGHSMGGLMAPLAAGSTRIDGIISYGTIGSNFIEYLAKTRRTIAKAYGWPPDETDKYIKDFCECAAWYLTNMLTVNEASKKNPDCGEYLSVFELRSQKY